MDLRIVPGAPLAVHEYPYGRRLAGSLRPRFDGLDYEIKAEVEPAAAGRDGVLVADGAPGDHRVLWLDGGTLAFETALGGVRWTVRTARPVPAGARVLAARVRASDGGGALHVGLRADNVALDTVTGRTPCPPCDPGETRTLDLGADLVGRGGGYAPPFPYDGVLRRVLVTTADTALDLDGQCALERALRLD